MIPKNLDTSGIDITLYLIQKICSANLIVTAEYSELLLEAIFSEYDPSEYGPSS